MRSKTIWWEEAPSPPPPTYMHVILGEKWGSCQSLLKFEFVLTFVLCTFKWNSGTREQASINQSILVLFLLVNCWIRSFQSRPDPIFKKSEPYSPDPTIYILYKLYNCLSLLLKNKDWPKPTIQLCYFTGTDPVPNPTKKRFRIRNTGLFLASFLRCEHWKADWLLCLAGRSPPIFAPTRCMVQGEKAQYMWLVAFCACPAQLQKNNWPRFEMLTRIQNPDPD